jgi:hypothetical protein
VLWFGNIEAVGELNAAVALRLPSNSASKLRLNIAGQSREATARGDGTNDVLVRFGKFEIKTPGYQRFALEALNASPPFGDLSALVSTGRPRTTRTSISSRAATPRRCISGIHFQTARTSPHSTVRSPDSKIRSPLTTWRAAGIAAISDAGQQQDRARRIIFSVWDSGNEAVSRGKVADENRVTLVAKAKASISGDFGNEGTGGHSHLKYNWKTGEKQRFHRHRAADEQHFHHLLRLLVPSREAAVDAHLFMARADGRRLAARIVFLQREFRRQQRPSRAQSALRKPMDSADNGAWIELTTASFSHDSDRTE